MDEMEFAEAESNLTDLVNEYSKFDVEEEEEMDEEEMEWLTICWLNAITFKKEKYYIKFG